MVLNKTQIKHTLTQSPHILPSGYIIVKSVYVLAAEEETEDEWGAVRNKLAQTKSLLCLSPSIWFLFTGSTTRLTGLTECRTTAAGADFKNYNSDQHQRGNVENFRDAILYSITVKTQCVCVCVSQVLKALFTIISSLPRPSLLPSILVLLSLSHDVCSLVSHFVPLFRSGLESSRVEEMLKETQRQSEHL